MSLEIEIAELRKAVVDLTAIITNNNIHAVGHTAVPADVAERARSGTAEKPAAKSKPKAAPKKEEAPVEDDLDLDGPADDTSADDDLGLDDEHEVPAVTKDDLKAEFQKLAKKSGGRETVQGILKKYKATSFNDLKDSDFAAALADVQKALK